MQNNCCPECRGSPRCVTDLVPCRALSAATLAFRGVDFKPSSTPLKKLPQLVYSMLSDEKLEAELKSLGLNSMGARDLNISLHREYMLLYNSALDGGISPDLNEMKKKALANARTKSSAALAPAAIGISFAKRPSSTTSESEPEVVRNAVKRARLAQKAKWTGQKVKAGEFRAVFSDVLGESCSIFILNRGIHKKPIAYLTDSSQTKIKTQMRLFIGAQKQANVLLSARPFLKTTRI